MITYTEKDIGLHRAIAAAGHSLVQIDGVWVASDEAAVQAIIDAFDPLPAAKSSAIAEIYRAVSVRLDQQAEGYGKAEVATWPMLQAEVLVYKANGTVGPMMSAVIARGRWHAAELSALLTPKINFQNAVLTARDNAVAAISSLNDWSHVQAVLAEHLAAIEAL